MSNKKRLFGTFGVRRTANDVLTPEFATRLAACYGTQIKGTVAIGGDTRTTSPMLMQAVTAGLLSSGCDKNSLKKRNIIPKNKGIKAKYREMILNVLK